MRGANALKRSGDKGDRDTTKPNEESSTSPNEKRRTVRDIFNEFVSLPPGEKFKRINLLTEHIHPSSFADTVLGAPKDSPVATHKAKSLYEEKEECFDALRRLGLPQQNENALRTFIETSFPFADGTVPKVAEGQEHVQLGTQIKVLKAIITTAERAAGAVDGASFTRSPHQLGDLKKSEFYLKAFSGEETIACLVRDERYRLSEVTEKMCGAEPIAQKKFRETVTDFRTGTTREFRELIGKIDARLKELGADEDSDWSDGVTGKHVSEVIRAASKDNTERVTRAKTVLGILNSEGSPHHAGLLRAYAQAFLDYRNSHADALAGDEFAAAFPALKRFPSDLFGKYVEAVAETGLAREMTSTKFISRLTHSEPPTALSFLSALRDTPHFLLSIEYIIARIPVKQASVFVNAGELVHAYSNLLEPLALNRFPKEIDTRRYLSALAELGISKDAMKTLRDGWALKHPQWLMRVICFAEKLGNYPEGSSYLPGFSFVEHESKDVKLYLGSLTSDESLHALTALSMLKYLQNMSSDGRRYYLELVYGRRNDIEGMRSVLDIKPGE